MISRTNTALLIVLVLLILVQAAGAATIQEHPVYTNTTQPGSSPQPAGSGALGTTATSALETPYKTNSWLSPILWADNQAEIYEGGGLDTGTPSIVYQRPVYPLPWSLWYNQDPYTNWDNIDAPLSTPTGTTGLFVRQAAITVHQDARLFSPDGKPDTSTLFMSALDCIHSKEGIQVDPGFNASHIRVNRMGDYDAELLLLASDDDACPAAIPANASLRIVTVRSSPFIHFAASGVPQTNLTIWSASTLNRTAGVLQVKGQNISYEIFTGAMPIAPPLGKPDVTSTNQTYILFFPEGQAAYHQAENSTETRTEIALTFAAPVQENYFVLATIPDASFTDEATLAVLAEAAFCYPTETTVSYTYDASTSSVTATYTLSSEDVLGLGDPQPIQGLLPIHYGDFFDMGSVLEGTPVWVQNGTGVDMAFETIKGTMKYLRQSSYSCTYHYPGILPSMPSLDTHDTEGIDNLTRWLDVFEIQNGPQSPAYTAFNDGKGTDTYTGAKVLGRNARFALAAESVGNTTLAGAVASSTKSGGIELFFRENPTNTQVNKSTGVAPYYALYNASIGTVLLYPASPVKTYFPSDTTDKPYDGYGTVTRLNDHHYTYGYIVNAAALLAMDNETWMNEYKDVINQLVFDVAYSKEIPSDNTFPEMRYWDAYDGHCAAGGLTSPDFLTGNNDESISEEINFWAGVILWGTASDQPKMTQIGIERYTVAVYANWAYWRDYFGTYQRLFDAVEGPGFDPRWVSTQYTAQVYDAQIKQSTFFGPHPTDITYITVAPVTPASFYLAMDKPSISTYLQDYEAYLKKYDLDPLNPEGTKRFGDGSTANQWYGQLAYYSELACWYAMADPDAALTAYFNVTPDWTENEYHIIPCVKMTHGGNSGATTYQFIRYLQVHGTPDPLEVYATNTPYFMTFEKGDERTYVAYNPTDAPLDIAFNDGTVLEDVPAHAMRTYPTGMPGPLAANFTANVTVGNVPLAVGFTDTSAGAITGWAWDFGDGGNATDQNPQHTFANQGLYSVNLTVENKSGASSSFSALIYAKQPGTLIANFTASTVDQAAGVGTYSSLALDANGSAHISYYDQTGGTVKYAWNDGAWHNESVYGSNGWSSLALDGNNTPHIAYSNAAGTSLNYATKQGDAWNDTVITPVNSAYPSLAISEDHGPCVAYQSVPLEIPRFSWYPPGQSGLWPCVQPEDINAKIGGDYVSLAMNPEQQVHMAYYHHNTTTLKHAWMPTWGAPEKWATEEVASANVGWTSIAFDAGGHAAIAYYDADTKRLMYAVNGSSWTTEVVDAAGDVGNYCSLAFNPMVGSDHAPGISYYDATNQSLKYAWKDDDAWYSVTVDTGNVGEYSSLAIDTYGYAHISYYDAGNSTLKYAVQKPAGSDDDIVIEPSPGPGSGSDGSDTGSSGPGSVSSAGLASSLKAGQSAVIPVSGGSINSLTVTVGSDVQNLQVTVTPSDSLPSSIPVPDSVVYMFQEVTPYGVNDSNVERVTYTFKVSKAWLEGQGYGTADVVLWRYNGTAWEQLPTTYVDEDGDYYTFTAESPGFSWYAIGIEKEATPETPVPTTAPETASTAVQPSPVQTTSSALPAEPASGFPMVAAGVAILVLAALAGVLVYRRRGKDE